MLAGESAAITGKADRTRLRVRVAQSGIGACEAPGRRGPDDVVAPRSCHTEDQLRSRIKPLALTGGVRMWRCFPGNIGMVIAMVMFYLGRSEHSQNGL
jgi:hypothetical protein